MKYNFDEIIDRANGQYSYSMKWENSEGCICLQTADMDFKTTPEVIEAMKGVAEHGIYGYSGVSDEYREAVVNWFKTRQGWSFDKEDIFFCSGTHTGVVECMKRYTKRGDGVIVLTPSYNYHWDIEPNERVFVGVEMIETDGYYTIDFDAFEKACEDENTTMYIICHPHNPTGRIWTPDELLKMAEICRKHHVLMVSDEVHGDLTRSGNTFEPMMKVVGPQGLITLTAVNKTFNLAGLAMTNIIIQDEELKKAFDGYFALPSPFGIAAVIAAYNHGSEWVDELNHYLDDNIDFVLDFIKENLPKAKMFRPEGGYIVWIDFRGYGLSDEEIEDRITNKAKVIMQTGKNFDSIHSGQFVRMCLSSPRSMIKEAFVRIAKEFE